MKTEEKCTKSMKEQISFKSPIYTYIFKSAKKSLFRMNRLEKMLSILTKHTVLTNHWAEIILNYQLNELTFIP